MISIKVQLPFLFANRFALITVGSEASSRTIMEKMPKYEIHGQNPMPLPCTKQSLSFFEGPSRKDGHVDQTPQMGILPRKKIFYL